MRRHWRIAALVLLTLGGTAPAIHAQGAPSTAPDNTKTNKRDRKAQEQTADQAKDNASDRELMSKIRRDIVSDKSLSTYAHNVKIIAKNGKVTLKGPVRCDEEKQAVESKAVAAAGAGNVVNQLAATDNNCVTGGTGSAADTGNQNSGHANSGGGTGNLPHTGSGGTGSAADTGNQNSGHANSGGGTGNLPHTGSSMPLVGMLGLLSLGGAALTRWLRSSEL